MPIRKIDPAGDIKRQVANTVKMVGMRYRFQSMGEYNAILGLYNVKCEPTDGRVNGREYHGLVYYALDDSGNIIASPFKASRLGRFASRTAIDGRFERSKEKTDIRPLRRVVAEVIERSSGKDDFIAGLKDYYCPLNHKRRVQLPERQKLGLLFVFDKPLSSFQELREAIPMLRRA